MVETATEEKVPLEAKNKPFMVCGFLGVFWNLSYGSEDHLGSTRMVLDEDGTVKEALMYQPYGTVSDVQGITIPGNDPLRQKFTTKEFDEEGDENGAPGIKAYYFGARYYDPELSVWLSCDPAGQFANAYGYANNPIIMADADGELAWFVLPMIIGALAGAYGGGVAANGSANPADWDFSSGKTWGYMLGGAVIGGASGVLGGAVAGGTTVLPYTGLSIEYGLGWGATAGIAAGSTANTLGMWAMTGGKSDISTSLGAVSFNWSAMARGEDGFGYLGKEGNSAMQNIGYGLGALSNVIDFGNQGAILHTHKGGIGHSAVTDKSYGTEIDFGPEKYAGCIAKARRINGIPGAAKYYSRVFTLARSTNDYGFGGGIETLIPNVNNTMVGAWGKLVTGLSKVGLLPYNALINNCSIQSGIGLFLGGIPNIPFHPFLLQQSVNLWNSGITPALVQTSSYHLQY